MSKPHNYGQMSLTERRQWDANEREKDDAEYAAREASEKAERAERDLRRSRESYRSEVNDFNDRIDRLNQENDDIENQLEEAKENLETTRTVAEFLRDFIARQGLSVAFLAWHRTTMMQADGTLPTEELSFQVLQNLFDENKEDWTEEPKKGGE